MRSEEKRGREKERGRGKERGREKEKAKSREKTEEKSQDESKSQARDPRQSEARNWPIAGPAIFHFPCQWRTKSGQVEQARLLTTSFWPESAAGLLVWLGGAVALGETGERLHSSLRLGCLRALVERACDCWFQTLWGKRTKKKRQQKTEKKRGKKKHLGKEKKVVFRLPFFHDALFVRFSPLPLVVPSSLVQTNRSRQIWKVRDAIMTTANGRDAKFPNAEGPASPKMRQSRARAERTPGETCRPFAAILGWHHYL